MSGRDQVALDVASIRSLSEPIEIDVVRKSDGELVEKVTILRYAGHFRSDSAEGIAVKDSEGKFRVRSSRELGISKDSDFIAYISISAIDLRTA